MTRENDLPKLAYRLLRAAQLGGINYPQNMATTCADKLVARGLAEWHEGLHGTRQLAITATGRAWLTENRPRRDDA